MNNSKETGQRTCKDSHFRVHFNVSRDDFACFRCSNSFTIYSFYFNILLLLFFFVWFWGLFLFLTCADGFKLILLDYIIPTRTSTYKLGDHLLPGQSLTAMMLNLLQTRSSSYEDNSEKLSIDNRK